MNKIDAMNIYIRCYTYPLPMEMISY